MLLTIVCHSMIRDGILYVDLRNQLSVTSQIPVSLVEATHTAWVGIDTGHELVGCMDRVTIIIQHLGWWAEHANPNININCGLCDGRQAAGEAIYV